MNPISKIAVPHRPCALSYLRPLCTVAPKGQRHKLA